MRYVVIVGMAIGVGLLARYKTKYRRLCVLIFVVALSVMSCAYNVRLLNKIIPLYRNTHQSFYNTDFLEKGEYPDSLLAMLFKNKTVYTKDDWMTLDQVDSQGKNFTYAYYHCHNMQNFIEAMKGKLVKDEAMNDTMLEPGLIEADFESLGFANDMFRYMFMYNDYEEEIGNYFTYYWYYYEYLDRISVYVCTDKDSNDENVFDAAELVVFWDQNKEAEEEDIYIMTKNYYDREVAIYE